uniref:zonular occludens toxin domain-containing protein n=1 Tax=Comamonas jiangduensis TaxID=1194168 RepID=UPI0024E125E7
MITVITGTPGAGKTLYAITKLLLPLIGTHVPVTDEDGVTTMHPRTIYTNIRGLLIDHELIDA